MTADTSSQLRLDNLGIAVRDVAAAASFFREGLGFDVEERDHDAEVNLGSGTRLYLFETATAAAHRDRSPELDDNPAGPDHVSFRVDDVDEACRRLQGRGIEFIHGPADKPDWGLRVAPFRDPDHNLYFLIKPL